MIIKEFMLWLPKKVYLPISSYLVEKPNLVKTKSSSSSENDQDDILFGEIPNKDHWFSNILKPKWINLFLGQECHIWAKRYIKMKVHSCEKMEMKK